MRVDIKARSVLLCGLEFHLTRTRPDVGGGARLLVLSRSSQVKFVKSKRRVCFSWTGGKVRGSGGRLLDSRSGDGVL